MMKIYVNGRNVGSDNSYSSCTASFASDPNLIFGGATSSDRTYWGMHIDDFAIWDNRILTSNEIIYVMNKGQLKEMIMTYLFLSSV